MIIGQHPIVNALDQSKWRCHLVGSRFCGVFREESDYDFIVEIPLGKPGNNLEHWYEFRDTFLKKHGFKAEESDLPYGPDARLEGGHVWSWKGAHPSVDVIPMNPHEAVLRLAFFRALKTCGNGDGGKFQRAMKSEKAWPTLWKAFAQAHHELTPQLIVTGSDVSIEQVKKQLMS